jgi:hypothetical protein
MSERLFCIRSFLHFRVIAPPEGLFSERDHRSSVYLIGTLLQDSLGRELVSRLQSVKI